MGGHLIVSHVHKQVLEKHTGEELLLNLDCLLDDLIDGLGVGPSAEVREEEAGKVGVETLITRDELVGEGESGHETALLEPEDGGE
jgi:hypothetical protein